MAKKIQSADIVPDPTSLNPTSAEEYLERGWLYYSRQKLDQAIADFKTAVEMKEDYSDALYALGLALKASGASQQALDAFKRIDQIVVGETDRQRATIISRLAHGQINQIRTGDWNLEKEVWQSRH